MVSSGLRSQMVSGLGIMTVTGEDLCVALRLRA